MLYRILIEARRFAQSVGIITYAGLQWVMMMFVLREGGLELVGDFAMSQAIAMPVFALSALSLRPLWVAGVIGQIPPIQALAYRTLTSGLSVVLIFLVEWLSGAHLNSAIFLFVVGSKFLDGVSDICFGAFDHEGKSEWAGFALFGKSSLLAIILAAFWLVQVPLSWTLTCFLAAQSLFLLAEVAFAVRRGPHRILWRDLPRLVPFRGASYSALNSLVASLAGFLPRYALDIFADRAAVGYFSIIFLPVAVLQMVATGLSQSSLRKVSAFARAGATRMLLRSSGPALMALLAVHVSAILIVGAAGVLAPWIAPTQATLVRDMAIVLVITSPLMFRQYLSYVAMATGRLDSIFWLGLAMLIFQASLTPFAVSKWGLWGTIGLFVIAGVTQTGGFILLISRMAADGTSETTKAAGKLAGASRCPNDRAVQ